MRRQELYVAPNCSRNKGNRKEKAFSKNCTKARQRPDSKRPDRGGLHRYFVLVQQSAAPTLIAPANHRCAVPLECSCS